MNETYLPGSARERILDLMKHSSEMLPWLRTFIGRIVRLEFSNPMVRRRWRDDLRALVRAYGEGGDDDAVQ